MTLKNGGKYPKTIKISDEPVYNAVLVTKGFVYYANDDQDVLMVRKSDGKRFSGYFAENSLFEEQQKRHSAVKDFESMRDMAELRALSKVSLERELSDKEYNRMMELGKKTGLKR